MRSIFLACLLATSVACLGTPETMETTTSVRGQTTTSATVAPPTVVAPSTTTTSAPTTTSNPDADTLTILFIGNSHTATHNIPAIVEALIESTLEQDAHTQLIRASFLRSAANDLEVTAAIESGLWDVIVLQGQEISQSHTIDYSREEAIALANAARDAGSRPLFFAEWKRHGHDETAYIEDIYQEIALASGSEVIPVGRAWDRLIARSPDHELWATDGNHSSPDGAYVAAAAIAYYIVGPEAQFETDGDRVPLLDAARATIEDYLEG